MQIKTFLARDMKEALTAMRAEMGEEASNKVKVDLCGGVMS